MTSKQMREDSLFTRNSFETTGKWEYPMIRKQEISLDDVEYADGFGAVIKLIGHAKREENGKITASVRPTLVSRDHILSSVNGVFNCVVVDGDQTGEVAFYGKGAGKEATASAVVADIIDCAKHLEARKYLFWEDGEATYVADSDEQTKLYIYAQDDDYNTLVDNAESLFGANASYIKNKFKNEIAILTDCDSESELLKKIDTLKAKTVKVMHTLF